MSQDENEDRNSSRDSRLESFLRQASAIISAEKGMTNAAKAKLEDLAARIHLPDELFEVGIRQLQDSNAPIGELTAYERGFLKFLSDEFERMPQSTVLSISMEEKAISHAKHKFEIPAHRAEQLIDFQTKESGFGRLSRIDAREFGRQSILDSIGEHVFVEPKIEERVFRLGRRWGFSAEEVQLLVQQRLRENQRAMKSRKRRPLLIASVAFLCLVALGGGLWWLFENRDPLFATRIDPLVDPKEVESTSDPHVESLPSTGAVAQLKLLFPDAAENLQALNVEQKKDALRAVVSSFLESSKNKPAKSVAIRNWILDARTEDAIVDEFVRIVDRTIIESPRTARGRKLQHPHDIVDLAIDICLADADAELASRQQAVASIVQVRTSVQARDNQSKRAAKSAIAMQQWNDLIQNAFGEPGRVSILIEPLASITSSFLDDQQQQEFIDRSVRSVLNVDSSQWRNMRNAILSSVARADEFQQIEWVELWLSEFESSQEFRRFVTPTLLESLAIETNGSLAEVESLLRKKRSQWRNRTLRPAISRFQNLNAKIEQLVPLFQAKGNLETVPDLVFKAAHAANLCLETTSILNSGRASDESAWRDFDAQFERLDKSLRETVFLDDRVETSREKVSSTGFDTTLLDRTMEAFADASEANQARRFAAIERLPNLVERFDSISVGQANVLAEYLTSPLEPDEWLRVQRVVPELVRWPRVLLAISDRLPESSATIDQSVMLYNLLTGTVWQGEKSTNWRDDLSTELFLLADRILTGQDAKSLVISDIDWLRLEKFLKSAYLKRHSFLKDPLSAAEADTATVVSIAAACLMTQGNNRRSQRVIEAIKKSTSNEIERLIAFNRLLINDSSGVANEPAEFVGIELLGSEFALLKRWQAEMNRQMREIADVD